MLSYHLYMQFQWNLLTVENVQLYVINAVYSFKVNET